MVFILLHTSLIFFSKQAHISYEAKTARDLLFAIGAFVAIGTFVANGTFEAIWNKICKSADDTPKKVLLEPREN